MCISPLSSEIPSIFLPLLLLLACQPDPIVSDLPEWTLERELTIGALDDSEQALTAVESIAVDADGNIYVGQSQDGFVRVFSPSGEFIRHIGREGEGPGEFTTVGRLGWMGDTLWVTEARAPKVNYFEKDGRFLTSKVLQSQLVEGQYWTSSVLGVAPDGDILARTTTHARAVQTGSVTTFPIYRLSPDGNPQGRVAEFSIGNRFLIIPLGGRGIGMPHPLPLDPLMAVSPSGEHLLFLHRKASANDERAPVHLVKVSAFGDTILTKEIPHVSNPLPAVFVDSVEAKVAQRLVDWGIVESVQDARPLVESNIDLPALAPPAVDLVEVSTGEIWIRRTLPGGTEDRWDVFSAEGVPLAKVMAPASTVIHESNGTYVWATERDRFDVSYVVRYRLGRG